jgi:hypothetical protein
MDIPNDGIITHQNCLAVLALQDAAALAASLGRGADKTAWHDAAMRLALAVNRMLWDDGRRAYLDCIHADGRRSPVFSQQTQTAALISGVAKGGRGARCRQILEQPPKGFVRAGSPFFMFFVLEALAREGAGRKILDIIRENWGFMLAQGATSFWELWTLTTGRLTRSHCHGWASAPTFYLSTAILGITPHPGRPDTIVFSPNPGDLRWMRGSVPTAAGIISVQGTREGTRWRYRVTIPEGCDLRNHARDAKVTITCKS